MSKGSSRHRSPGPRGPMGMRKVEKAKDFKGAMIKLIRYLGVYKIIIFIAIIIAIGSTAANIVGPKILGKATTRLFEGLINVVRGTGEIDFAYIGKILLIALSLYLASISFSAWGATFTTSGTISFIA
mgnify:CR=1 FL=1